MSNTQPESSWDPASTQNTSNLLSVHLQAFRELSSMKRASLFAMLAFCCFAAACSREEGKP